MIDKPQIVMAPKILTLVIWISIHTSVLSQTILSMEREGGVYFLPCTINGVGLRFVFDTGANTVTISLTEAMFMLKNGYLDKDDIIGTSYAQLANGEVTENTKIILRKVEIGGIVLEDITASIVHELDAPLLLGQSVIERLGPIQINGRELIILDGADNTINRGNGSQYADSYVHCDPLNPTEVVEVLNPTTNKVWMDRNLGASRVATSHNDVEAYGDYYQWGRFADGHQCRDSETTSTNATTAVPSARNVWSRKFIYDFSDWLSVSQDNLWQGVDGANNPCPSGYRLPNKAEWDAERQSWESNNRDGAFGSPLRLPYSGYRSRRPFYVGFYGYYWSSSVSGSNALGLNFAGSFALLSPFPRANGFAVRCLKN